MKHAATKEKKKPDVLDHLPDLVVQHLSGLLAERLGEVSVPLVRVPI